MQTIDCKPMLIPAALLQYNLWEQRTLRLYMTRLPIQNSQVHTSYCIVSIHLYSTSCSADKESDHYQKRFQCERPRERRASNYMTEDQWCTATVQKGKALQGEFKTHPPKL